MQKVEKSHKLLRRHKAGNAIKPNGFNAAALMSCNLKGRSHKLPLNLKSQITLFLLMGMVMVIVFGFLFYTSYTLTKTKMDKMSEKIVTDLLETTALKYYVTTCLEDSTRKGLKILGQQGGFFYENQGSIIDWYIPYIDYEDDEGKTSKVSYHIYHSISGKIKERSLLIADPPYYPCFLSGNPDWVGHTCYLNYDHLQKMYRFGTTSEPEKNINPDLCKEDISIAGYSCSCSNAQNCKYSVQSQLEAFIENKTAECVDFSSFEGYNITMEKIKANITFGKNDVNVKIAFPITIRIKGYQPVVRVLDFYANEPVRFKNVFDVAKNIIKEEINDVEFRVEEDSLQFTNAYPGISVEKDDFLPNTTIIKIIDSNSKIDGENYVFMFARENRHPALDYFKKNPYRDYDMYIIAGKEIEFSPIGYDPDEDNLIYDYNGWNSDLLKNSDPYQKGDNCINPITGGIDIKRCASYTTSDDDIGEREVVITTTDVRGYSDWQTVRILVDDIPIVVADLNNFYSDISDDYASIEDIYFIDLSSTTNLVGGDVIYKLDDSKEPFSYDWSSTDKIYFPSQSADINNMAGYVFDTVGTHKIKVQVKDQDFPADVGTKDITVEVKECLPHRNNATPYPFNSYNYDLYPDETDPFQANHTCCINYQIQEGNECYYLEDYGCITHFDASTMSNSYYYSHFNSLGLNPTLLQYNFPRSDSRDVYKRTIKVRCSGTRGNICEVSRSPLNYDYIIQPAATCPTGQCCRHSLFNETYACGACA